MTANVDSIIEGVQNAPSEIYGLLMKSAANYSQLMLSAFDSEFIFWARIIAILYIMLAAYMWGVKGGGIQLAISMITMAFLITVCFNASNFEYWVIAPIEDIILFMPGKILSASLSISGAEANSSMDVFNIFGQMFGHIFKFSYAINAKFSWFNLPGKLQIMFACALLFCLFCAVMLIFLFYMVMCSAGVFVFMTIGPFCIFLGSFKFSRAICFAWFRHIAQLCLIPFFAALLLALTIGIIRKQLEIMVSQDTPVVWSVDYLVCVVLSAVSIALLLKAPDFAAALSGARAGSTAGIAAAVGKAGGLAGGAIGASLALGSQGAGSLAGLAGNIAGSTHQQMWQNFKQSIQGRP